MKLRVNDKVKVTAGKDKGKTGVVKELFADKNKALVEGINKVKKHIKAKQGQPGDIIEKEAPIHVSNLRVLCPKTDKPTRIGYVITESGEKARVAKVSGELIPTKFTKQ